MLLDLVSFNVRCCDDKDGNSIDERAPRLEKLLHQISADVLTFQEIRPKWVPEIERIFSKDYEIFLCYRSQEKPEGLITLWKKERFNCLEKGFFWLSDTPEVESRGWDEKYDCPRICSYALLKEKGSEQTFLAMNTHFGFGDTCQLKSVDLIKKYRNRFSDVKAFVAGDFNMLPQSPAHIEIQRNFVDANQVTIRDRRATFHNYHPAPDQIFHIDYIFCDQRIFPKTFKILDGDVDGKYPSDHFGIYSQLFL